MEDRGGLDTQFEELGKESAGESGRAPPPPSHACPTETRQKNTATNEAAPFPPHFLSEGASLPPIQDDCSSGGLVKNIHTIGEGAGTEIEGVTSTRRAGQSPGGWEDRDNGRGLTQR